MLPDNPGRSLCFWIDRTANLLGGFGDFVGIVAAEDALLVDGKLHDQMRVLLLVADHGKDAEWQPGGVRRRLGRHASLSEISGLLAELLSSPQILAVHHDRAVLISDIISVVVPNRCGIGSIKAVDRLPACRRPGI